MCLCMAVAELMLSTSSCLGLAAEGQEVYEESAKGSEEAHCRCVIVAGKKTLFHYRVSGVYAMVSPSFIRTVCVKKRRCRIISRMLAAHRCGTQTDR